MIDLSQVEDMVLALVEGRLGKLEEARICANLLNDGDRSPELMGYARPHILDGSLTQTHDGWIAIDITDDLNNVEQLLNEWRH